MVGRRCTRSGKPRRGAVRPARPARLDGDGDTLPSADIGKVWEDTTLLSIAAGHDDAASVFEDATELETDNGVEVHFVRAAADAREAVVVATS